MARAYQPNAEDLAKAEARRLKKEQARQDPPPKAEDERGRILPREWVEISSAPSPGQTLRVMTWNVSGRVGIWPDSVLTVDVERCTCRYWLRPSFVSRSRIQPSRRAL